MAAARSSWLTAITDDLYAVPDRSHLLMPAGGRWCSVCSSGQPAAVHGRRQSKALFIQLLADLSCSWQQSRMCSLRNSWLLYAAPGGRTSMRLYMQLQVALMCSGQQAGECDLYGVLGGSQPFLRTVGQRRSLCTSYRLWAAPGSRRTKTLFIAAVRCSWLPAI